MHHHTTSNPRIEPWTHNHSILPTLFGNPFLRDSRFEEPWACGEDYSKVLGMTKSAEHVCGLSWINILCVIFWLVSYLWTKMYVVGVESDHLSEVLLLILLWVKVFRIIPEFRILRLTFYRKSASKCWIREMIIASLIYFQSKGNWNCEYLMGILQA